jgi:hypothetical protein
MKRGRVCRTRHDTIPWSRDKYMIHSCYRGPEFSQLKHVYKFDPI